MSDVSEKEDAAVAPAAGAAELEARVIEAVKTVFDPEIPVNIYELGLIYSLEVSQSGNVEVEMTLTTPACPVAGSLPGEVETRIREVEGVGEVTVQLVWDPPWSPDRMTEAAKLELGFL
ncbi:MAG: SUF system Fe-S cluster assembly protein [Rhodospirillaceae bacterium]